MNKTKRVISILPLIFIFSSSLAQAVEYIAKNEPVNISNHQSQAWHSLVWKAKGSELMVTNTGKFPVHLGRDVKLMPDDMPLTLLKTSLEAGETLQVYGACPEHLPLQKEVIITVRATNGQQDQLQKLPINH